MKIVILKVRTIFAMVLLIMLGMASCAPSRVTPTPEGIRTSTPGDVPLWTPRPVDLTRTAFPTPTRLAPISTETPIPPTVTVPPVVEMTPETVRVRIAGGNLSVRRGPSPDYNYIGVLYDGQIVLATGRDRVSRWIRIALPSNPQVEGWITTETSYTVVDGDIPNLPYIETEPARPAFIRNCTFNEMLVRPIGAKLLSRIDEPDNEERFSVGVYEVYDLENPDNRPIQEVDLSEGETVEILYDWTGEKSKCR